MRAFVRDDSVKFSIARRGMCQPVTPTAYPSSCMGHARGVAAPLFALYSAESNPRPFERTGQPTPPTAQAVDVRHVGNGAYKAHIIAQTQATRIYL